MIEKKPFVLEDALKGKKCITAIGIEVEELRKPSPHHYYGHLDMPVEYRMKDFSFWCCCSDEGICYTNRDLDLFMK